MLFHKHVETFSTHGSTLSGRQHADVREGSVQKKLTRNPQSIVAYLPEMWLGIIRLVAAQAIDGLIRFWNGIKNKFLLEAEQIL